MPVYECEKYIPPGYFVCGTNHCTHLMKTSPAIEFCECKDWKGNKIPGCPEKSATVPYPTNECFNKKTNQQINNSFEACLELIYKDSDWTWRVCYCCCSCYAWYTRIAVSKDSVKYVQHFQQDDEIYAASVVKKGKEVELVWKTLNVAFSGGTGPSKTPQDMMVILFGDIGSIFCTADQIFVLSNGSLITAERLIPGEHLLTENGEPTQVVGVFFGKYTGGIHHLATSLESDAEIDIDGHLLSTNGLVTGDFYLQVLAGSPKVASHFVPDFDSRPLFGSVEYRKLPGIEARAFSAVLPGYKLRSPRSPYFTPYEETTIDAAPASWRRYVTDEQAQDLKKAPHVLKTEPRNQANFDFLYGLFKGFFPDVRIVLDKESDVPNLYAYKEDGERVVKITARLLRVKCIEREGLALILAHGIARFLGTAVVDAEGYACTGQADFFGASYVLITSFYFDWSSVATQGYIQVKKLFDFIQPKESPNADECSSPSISCRLQALSNAISSMNLPVCAGAPLPARLRLVSAEASVIEDQTSVIAVFNEPVSPYSGETLENYRIKPALEITSARLQLDAPQRVILTVTLTEEPKEEYMLRVDDIYSERGSSLNKDGRNATFTIGAAVMRRR